jgi:hypothetical protein
MKRAIYINRNNPAFSYGLTGLYCEKKKLFKFDGEVQYSLNCPRTHVYLDEDGYRNLPLNLTNKKKKNK